MADPAVFLLLIVPRQPSLFDPARFFWPQIGRISDVCIISAFAFWGISLSIALARFYRSEDDFQFLYLRLKLTLCPHCKVAGTLILHGKLHGYAENDDNQKSCRGRRVFCNNRKERNNGCGHTFSVWEADKLKRSRIGANALWTFVKLVISLGNKAKALRSLNMDFSVSSAYRIWNRFDNSQSHIRTALAKRCLPPKMPHTRQPAEQTIVHLEAAFPHESCPIVAFQHQLQISFL